MKKTKFNLSFWEMIKNLQKNKGKAVIATGTADEYYYIENNKLILTSSKNSDWIWTIVQVKKTLALTKESVVNDISNRDIFNQKWAIVA